MIYAVDAPILRLYLELDAGSRPTLFCESLSYRIEALTVQNIEVLTDRFLAAPSPLAHSNLSSPPVEPLPRP